MALAGRIVPGRIEAQPVIRELAHAEPSLLRRLDGDGHVGLALGERKGAGEGDELDGEPGMTVHQRAEVTRQV